MLHTWFASHFESCTVICPRTLVVNVAAIQGDVAIQGMLGVKFTGNTSVSSGWGASELSAQPATPFEVVGTVLNGAEMIASDGALMPMITRNKMGAGAVILTLVPHMIGLDERAHPALPWLMNGLTEKLLPVQVRTPNGDRLTGEIMYQVNKNKAGWVVTLVNNKGVDKTQSGIARVDRSQYVDVVLHTALPVKSAKEYTQPRVLPINTSNPMGTSIVNVRVDPGGIQVVGLM